MSSRQKCTVNIDIAPKCDKLGHLDHILVKLVTGGLNGGLTGGRPWNKDDAVFTLRNQFIDSNANFDYGTVRHAQAADEIGELGLDVECAGKDQSWHFDREPHGAVTINLEAHAFKQDDQNDSSTSLAKYEDGIVGIGASFLPIPSNAETFDVSITWDLACTAEGTRAVTSFGEGSVSTTATARSLAKCVFMVGNVGSYPPLATNGNQPAFCGTFWLGDLPPNLDALKSFSNDMFPHLCNFFQDQSSSYRAFIRKTSHGLRGRTLATSRSSLIEYGEDAKDATDWELVRILNKSMIASWVNLDPEDDGTPNDWFREGLSHLYTIYLPFRFKQRSPDYFRATLNGYLTSYFTNPHINLSLESLQTSTAENPHRFAWHTEPLLPMRACLYMIRTDAFTRRSERARDQGVERPIDGIVAEIVSRKKRGELVQEKDWIKLVGEWIGEEAAKLALRDMKSGRTMDLDDLTTAFGGIDSVEMTVMQVGFDKRSFDIGHISGLVPSSAAEAAGLLDGDQILWHSRLDRCEADCTAELKLNIRRNDQNMTFSYVPRSREAVKGWQSIKRDTK